MSIVSAFKKEKYLPAFDGLRAISVLIVLLSHLKRNFIIPGGFGVTIFFFISGFLITRLLIAEYERNDKLDLKGFYVRRLLRLYPPLLLMIVIYTIIIKLFNSQVGAWDISAALFYFENYFYVHFKGLQKADFSILWSLAIEEHFYFFFPLLFIFVYKRKIIINAIIGLIIMAFITRLFYSLTLSPKTAEEYTYYLTECRYDSILFGCLSALLLSKSKEVYVRIIEKPIALYAALFILLFTFLIRNDLFRSALRYSVQGVCLMFIIPAVVLIPSGINKTLSAPYLIHVGKISYSVYMMQWIAIYVADNSFERETIPWVMVIISGTIILSYFSYYFIEKNILLLRRRYGFASLAFN